MSGPVGIVSTISEVGNQSATVRDGLQNIAYLGAFIAINLAVMNMLPLPALDGGRIFLLLVEFAFLPPLQKRKFPPNTRPMSMPPVWCCCWASWRL